MISKTPCVSCGTKTARATAYHDIGCGYLNDEKSNMPHKHNFCLRCGKDWIDRSTLGKSQTYPTTEC